jgi:hypothetical protein
MTKLTEEQIKTLEDVFASYPEDFSTSTNFASMQGIEKQLESLNGEPGDIFYFSNVDTKGLGIAFSVEKMKVS